MAEMIRATRGREEDIVMDPVVGSLLIAAIQSLAALAKQYGMSLGEAEKYFQEGYAQVKVNIPGKLPDA
jgi:hypothetical protein